MNNHLIKSAAPAIILGIALGLASPINAQDNSRISRYMSVPNVPLAAQRDLLAQTMEVRFPAAIKTVGEAMRYLLLFSGYRLAPGISKDKAVQTMLSNPLPAIDRTLGPISLKEGLKTLAGPSFVLLADPIHRLIGFKLNPRYQALYSINI